MSYIDEEFNRLRWQEKKEHFRTLETGIYINDELIEFERIDIPELSISVAQPKTFVRMPPSIAQIKYPAVTRPQIIQTSLDTTVNFTFSVYQQNIPSDKIRKNIEQMKQMLKRVNPANTFFDIEDDKAGELTLSWFNYKGFAIDSNIYSIMYLMSLAQGKVLHGTFNCRFKDMNEWHHAALQVIRSIALIK